MAHVDRRFSRPLTADPALALFHRARQAMNAALVAWINSDPDPADLALEADGTTSAIRQLVALARSDVS